MNSNVESKVEGAVVETVVKRKFDILEDRVIRPARPVKKLHLMEVITVSSDEEEEDRKTRTASPPRDALEEAMKGLFSPEEQPLLPEEHFLQELMHFAAPSQGNDLVGLAKFFGIHVEEEDVVTGGEERYTDSDATEMVFDEVQPPVASPETGAVSDVPAEDDVRQDVAEEGVQGGIADAPDVDIEVPAEDEAEGSDADHVSQSSSTRIQCGQRSPVVVPQGVQAGDDVDEEQHSPDAQENW